MAAVSSESKESKSAGQNQPTNSLLEEVLRLVTETDQQDGEDSGAGGALTRGGETIWETFCKHAKVMDQVKATAIVDFAYTDCGRLQGAQSLFERLYAFEDIRFSPDDQHLYRMVLHVHTMITWQHALGLPAEDRAREVTAVNLRVMKKRKTGDSDSFEECSEKLHLLPQSEALKYRWRDLHAAGEQISWRWRVPISIPDAEKKDRSLKSGEVSSMYRKVASIIALGEELLQEKPGETPGEVQISNSRRQTGMLVRGGVEEEFIVVASRGKPEKGAVTTEPCLSPSSSPWPELSETSSPPETSLSDPAPPSWPFSFVYVGANYSGSKDLSLDKEVRAIKDVMQKSLGKKVFEETIDSNFKVELCASTSDFFDLLKKGATVLHIGCHGEKDGLHFEDLTVDMQTIVDIISKLQQDPDDPSVFRRFRLVVVNACTSYEIARRLSDVVDFVVGLTGPVQDKNAILFSSEFYKTLLESSLEKSFEFAKCIDKERYRLLACRVKPSGFSLAPPQQNHSREPTARSTRSPETEEDKKLSQLPWKEVVAWFHRINIHPRVIAILEEDKVSGAQLARMDLKELMEDLELRKLQAQRVLMRENIFETIIHATAHALSESLSNDSFLSDVDTEEAASSGDESQDGLDGWDTIAEKHPGQPEEFRDHMRGLVTELREFMSIAHEGSEEEQVDLDFGGRNSQQWTYCMLLWLQFAKEASTDEPCRKRWLACVCHGCSQDLLLQELGVWLQQPQTCHPDWSLASFSQLRCEKQHAACVFITDRNVQRQLEAFPVSRQVWTKSIVSEWFANDEPASTFLSRANRFLQRHLIEGVEVLDKVIPTHSYVAFMFATKLAAQLLFAYLEAHSISTPAAPSAGATAFALHGFSAFVSSGKSSFVAPGSLQPSRASKAVVLQGLRCLSHLALSQRDLLGPIRPLVEFVADGAVQQSGPVQSPHLGTEEQDVQLSVQSSGGPSLNEQEVQALVQVLVKQAGIRGTIGLGQLEGKQESEDVPAAFNPPLDAAMAKLEGLLPKQGPVDSKGLERGLELLSRKAGAVERADFDTALGFCGVSLGEEEASTVFQALDRGDLVVGCAELVQSVCPSLLSPRIEASLRGVLETDSAEKKPDESGCNLRFLLQFSSLVLPKHSMAFEHSDEQGAATKATEQARKLLDLPDQELLQKYLQDSVSQTEKCVDSATGEMLDIEGHFTSLKAIEKRSLLGECDASEDATQADLVCNINLSIMDDPVRLSGDGEIETKCYERGEITRQMQEKGTSPQSRRRFDGWELVPAGDKKEEITAYIKGVQEKLLGEEQQMEGEEERQLMLHRKGYAPSRAIDPRSQSKIVSDDDILKDCCSGEKAFCVIGPPASGKTTTMLRIATRAANHALADESALIPLFLRATKLASLLSESALEADRVVDFVEFYIQHAPQLQAARSVLLSLYRQGQLLVIVDGLDEAGVYRSAIERFLEPLAAQHSVGGFQGNHLLLSTRTSSYTESRVWLRLTKFVPLEIQPLDERMARAIIHHRVGNDAEEEVLWRDLQTVAKNNPQLLANPFLLCLVVSIFKQRGRIPSQRGELYRLSVEGMVRRSLSTAAPAEALHSEAHGTEEQAMQFLECVAFVCHLGESPTRDFILDDTFMVLVQDRWSNHLGHPCELLPVLKAALADEALCGVLTRVAGGKKRFSHLTQQEFLAACHLVHCAARSSDPARQVLDTLARFSMLDPWIREVLLHCACLLQDDGAFVQFCSLILEKEDGTIAHSEVVKDLMAERGASEEVSAMLEQKFQALRPIEDVVAALCHPSCDLRERAITELRSFSFSAGHAFVTKVSNQLASVVKNEEMGLFTRRAAILSLVQLCDDRSSVDVVRDLSELLVWCLSEEELYKVAVKGLGTLEAGSSNGHCEVADCMLTHLANSNSAQASVVRIVGALADLKLTSSQLVLSFAELLNQRRFEVLSDDKCIRRYLKLISNSDCDLGATKDARRAYLKMIAYSFSALSHSKGYWTITHQLLRKYEGCSGPVGAAEMELVLPLVGQRGLLETFGTVLEEICSKCAASARDLDDYLGSSEELSGDQLLSGDAMRLDKEGLLAAEVAKLAREMRLLSEQESEEPATVREPELQVEVKPEQKERARERESERVRERERESEGVSERDRERESEGVCEREWERESEGVSEQTLRGWDLFIGETSQASSVDVALQQKWRASCRKLWELSFEGFDAVEDVQGADPEIIAFLRLKFQVGDPPLELNSRRWATYVINEVLSMRSLGRCLFAPILRHVESTLSSDPARSAQALQPLLEALSHSEARNDAAAQASAGGKKVEGEDAVDRQMRLEKRHLLKELQVGCRCDTRSLWSGEIASYEEAGGGTGGKAHGWTEVGGGKKKETRAGKGPTDKPRILAFFAQERNDPLDTTREAQALTRALTRKLSASKIFELHIHPRPRFEDFHQALMRSQHENVQVVHLAGYADTKEGFFFAKDDDGVSSEAIDPSVIAAALCPRSVSKGGTVECVVLNACSTEGMARMLRGKGIKHVVCWRGKVRDGAAIAFSEAFYNSLQQQTEANCSKFSDSAYKAAFADGRAALRVWLARNFVESAAGRARQRDTNEERDAVVLLSALGDDLGNVSPQAGTEDGVGASRQHDSVQGPTIVGGLLSSDDTRSVTVTNRTAQKECAAFQSLGVKMEFPAGSSIEKGTNMYAKGMIAPGQLARFGLEEDPNQLNPQTGKQHLRLTLAALQFMFRAHELPADVPLREYADLFGARGVVVEWAKRSNKSGRFWAANNLKGSLQIREEAARKWGGGDAGHEHMMVAIRECVQAIESMDQGAMRGE